MPLTQQPVIFADVPPGAGYTGNFTHCVKIINLEKYPDYLVFIQLAQVIPTRPTSPYVLVQSSECIVMYNTRSVATIAAIAKDKIKSTDLVNVRSGKNYDKLPEGMRWRVDHDFSFLQNVNLEKALIKASPIKSPREMPFIYEGKQIEDSFQIQSIDPNGMQLSLVSRSPQMINWIIFPLIGALLLGWVIWRRKTQMGSST